MARTSKTTASASTETATPRRRTRKPAVEVVQNGTPFVATLTARMEQAGLNKNKLAIRAGLAPANVAAIFSGKIALTPKAAIFIAPALGTTATELLTEQIASQVAAVQSTLSAEEQARLNFINALNA